MFWVPGVRGEANSAEHNARALRLPFVEGGAQFGALRFSSADEPVSHASPYIERVVCYPSFTLMFGVSF